MLTSPITPAPLGLTRPPAPSPAPAATAEAAFAGFDDGWLDGLATDMPLAGVSSPAVTAASRFSLPSPVAPLTPSTPMSPIVPVSDGPSIGRVAFGDLRSQLLRMLSTELPTPARTAAAAAVAAVAAAASDDSAGSAVRRRLSLQPDQ
jgi:hypothetical protein